MFLPKINPCLGRCIAVLLLALCGYAVANTETYQYFRFRQTALRGGGAENSIQLAEFEMRFEGAALPGAIATNPGGNFPGAEGPEKAVDGLLTTKWLDFNKQALVLDFGTPVVADGYRFATANDAPDRDPISWVVEGSDDGFSWVVVDTVECHPTTTDRQVYEQEFLFCRPRIGDFSTTTQIVANGGTASLNWDTANADTLEIDNAVGIVTGDIGSTTVTPPSDADTTYTLTASSTLGAATAALTVRAVAPGTATYQFIRFSPIRLRETIKGQPGANSIQIDEFQFFNGVTEVIPVDALDDGNTPGAEGPLNLIDGFLGTKWLNFGKTGVVFDLGSQQTIDSYSFTTANDAPERDPIAWILEGSNDQVCWIPIDNVTEEQGNPGVEFNFLPPAGRGVATQKIPLPATAAVPPPVITLFGGLPQIVADGTPVMLLWETDFACTLSILPDVGLVTGDIGNTTTTPPANMDTIYTLTATNVPGDQAFFQGAVRSVAQGSASYELVRFTPLRLAESLPFFGGANSIQIAEFKFFSGGIPIDIGPTGLNAIVTNPGGNSPGGEGPGNVVDGLATTKWLDFNKQGLEFDFGAGTPLTFDSYRWTTANDAPERDPVAWRLEGSNDGGATWDLIDNVDQNRDGTSGDIAFYFGLPRGFNVPPIPVPAATSLPPLINLFTGDAGFLFPGETVNLTWDTINADTVTLDDGTGPVTVADVDSQPETPIANTTWTLTATNAAGSLSAQFTTTIVTSTTDIICYEDFDSAGDELILLGDAAVVNDFANVPLPGDASRLRLTPDAPGTAGTAWFAKRIDLAGGFQTFFDLHLLGANNNGADGMAFIIQNTPAGNVAEPDGFNEEGFPTKSVNIKFDSFQNAGEFSAASVTITENGFIADSVDLTTVPGLNLAGSTPDDLSSDDFTVAPYRVQIDYDGVNDEMDVYINGILVIDAAFVDLAAAEAVTPAGTGWVGFSARTGGEFENHDVTRWILIPGPPPPFLELTDYSFDFGADTAVFTFTSGTTRSYRVTQSTDGVTFTDLATGIPGQAGSTTTAPIPFTEMPVHIFRVETENPLKTP